MKLVAIPAGEFEMGSHDTFDTLQRDFPQYAEQRIHDLDDEKPLHKVRITREFFLGQHEVTKAQFRAFAEQAPYRAESERDGTGGWGYNPKSGEFEGRNPKYSWRDPGFPQTDNDPVTNVTWNDANEFCRWLSEKEKATYRLPTEAEWEYACRAGTTTRYANGDQAESLVKIAALYDANTRKRFPEWKEYALQASDGFAFTAPVGSFAANAFHLYDMHGNVWELCADRYGEDYYQHSPVDDPQGPETGHRRVRRGGSWHTWPFYMRTSFRNWNTPTTRYLLVGFRVVKEIKP